MQTVAYIAAIAMLFAAFALHVLMNETESKDDNTIDIMEEDEDDAI